MRREVMENCKKYWSNEQSDEEELDEVDEVGSSTKRAFST